MTRERYQEIKARKQELFDADVAGSKVDLVRDFFNAPTPSYDSYLASLSANERAELATMEEEERERFGTTLSNGAVTY
jgi:hypothetical protein